MHSTCEALGKTFDPSVHEAALRRPGGAPDEILEELRPFRNGSLRDNMRFFEKGKRLLKNSV